MADAPRFSAAHISSAIRGKLIVSCQALPSEPLFGSDIMAKMAIAAMLGGAAAIRANTPQDIAAIRAAVALPIIGLYKVDVPGYDVYITPRLVDAVAIATAGCDLIALDATHRPHPEGTTSQFIQSVKRETGLPIMADISNLDEGVAAKQAGADFISTTMSGYTHYSPHQERPDYDLVRDLSKHFGNDYPLIAEGRYSSPDEVVKAFGLGAWAVVVGGAITRPQQITAKFVKALSG